MSPKYPFGRCKQCRSEFKRDQYRRLHESAAECRRRRYERLKSDPEALEAHRRYQREWWHSKKRENNLRVAKESFRPFWDQILTYARSRFSPSTTRNDGTSFLVEDFCVWAGITKEDFESIQNSMRKNDINTLSFDLVDTILVNARMEHVFGQLYIVKPDKRGAYRKNVA